MGIETIEEDGVKSMVFRGSMECDMNDPDTLEETLLMMAHEMAMNKEDEAFAQIGKLLKPLFSAFCEALRIHNATNANNAVFLNTMLNFAGMATSMAIAGSAKNQAKIIQESIDGFAHVLKKSCEGASPHVEKPTRNPDISAIEKMVARYMSSKNGKMES